MSSIDVAEGTGFTFEKALSAAAQFPGVRINRAAYLQKALIRYCSASQVQAAIE